MKEINKISIVTPVFNQVEFIEKTIRSVLDQNYPDLEYIIVDGGSTDGTLDVIEKYRDHLAYFVSEPDNGMYFALQKGFDRTTGSIMGWINADDYLHKSSLFTINQILSIPQVKWFTGMPTTCDISDRVIHTGPNRRWSKYHYFRGDIATIQQESTYWSRDLWEETGGKINTDLKLAGDFELWLRFFLNGAKLYTTDALIGCFRQRENQLSTALDIYHKEVKETLRNLELNKEDIRNIKRLDQLEKVKLRIPFVRSIMGYQKKYNEILAIPPKIIYNRKSNNFEPKYIDGLKE